MSPTGFATVEDIREWITASVRADWEVAHRPDEPTFSLGPLLVGRTGPRPHEWRATYLPRPTVSLLWGRDIGRPYRPDWQPPGWTGTTQLKIVETVFTGSSERRGTSIDRHRFAVVDSGRCYLPSPTRRQVPEVPGRRTESRWTVSAYEHALLRLLNELRGILVASRSLDDYLREAGIEAVD